MLYLDTALVTAAGIPGTWTSQGLNPGSDCGLDVPGQYWVAVTEHEIAFHVMLSLLCMKNVHELDTGGGVA